METPTFLTLKEASLETGLSRDTIWRAVKNGQLSSVRRSGVGGVRFLIEASVLKSWTEQRLSGLAEPPQTDQTVQTDTSDTRQKVQTVASDTPDSRQTVASESSDSRMVPIEAHMEALRTVREAVQSAQTSQERAQAAEEMAARYSRQLEALRYELSRHQLVLAEQAESIAEVHCQKLQAEERAQRLLELEASQEDLRQENLAALKEFELERAALTERLKISEGRVDWLEKRVPRWVRSLFRAG